MQKRAFEDRLENQLLLCAARVSLEGQHAQRFRSLLGGRLDWEYVLRTAQQHGVMPLLYRHVQAADSAAVPSAVFNRLRADYNDNGLRNVFLTGELLKLLALFAGQGISAIPYKGPVLAAFAYGNVAMRQFSDLDLLIRKRDMSRARDVMLAQGYRLDFNLTPAQEPAYLRWKGQLPFILEDGCLVELHTDILPKDFGFPLKEEDLLQRLMPVVLMGQEVQTIAGEDLLLLLCAHASKHFWKTLGWVCDVAELVLGYPRMDWTRVLEQAKALHCERMLNLGLVLARDLLQAVIPPLTALPPRVGEGEGGRSRILEDSTVVALAATVRRRLFCEDHRSGQSAASALFHLRVRERPRDGARYCLSLILMPTTADRALVSLPSWLFFLPYLLRPWRLAVKYGARIIQALRLRQTKAR